MALRTIALCKFVGTISLGLLTGVSYSLSNLIVPSLLVLPSAAQAQYSFTRLQHLGLNHLRALSGVSVTSLLLAYVLSPRRGQHPYLLWTVLSICLGVGADIWLGREARVLIRNQEERDDAEPSINGEEIRKGMEQFQMAQRARAVMSSLGFFMSVVGIWGDGI